MAVYNPEIDAIVHVSDFSIDDANTVLPEIVEKYRPTFFAVEYPNTMTFSKYTEKVIAFQMILAQQGIPVSTAKPGEWKTSRYKKWYKNAGVSTHCNDAANIAKYVWERGKRRNDLHGK